MPRSQGSSCAAAEAEAERSAQVSSAQSRHARNAQRSLRSFERSREAWASVAGEEFRLRRPESPKVVRPKSAPTFRRSASMPQQRPRSAQVREVDPMTGRPRVDPHDRQNIRSGASFELRMREDEDRGVVASERRRPGSAGSAYSLYSIPRGTPGAGSSFNYWRHGRVPDAERAVRVHSTGDVAVDADAAAAAAAGRGGQQQQRRRPASAGAASRRWGLDGVGPRRRPQPTATTAAKATPWRGQVPSAAHAAGVHGRLGGG
eukprot:TRINITY_DN64673_c0_g1_i1.p1 TRINITY_DN64673_c0_g1~~TRINITY_DN64673_c0_g1_i1.p1  ORF type:complete len:261 (-),score=40.45 TRINITY_DN64673_c0_g1_i1:54-836(-)